MTVTPDAGADRAAFPPTRPARPVPIELAAAILIVGGMTSIIGRALAVAVVGPPEPGAELAWALTAAFDIVTVVIGFLARSGRGWILGINVVAVAVFLYLTAFPNVVALFFALVFGFVLVVLLVNRPWFDAMRAWRDAQPQDRR